MKGKSILALSFLIEIHHWHLSKLLFLPVLLSMVATAKAQVDQQRAQEYFKEAQAICDRDSGRLWGVPISAPMVIFDRQTQTIAVSITAPTDPRPQLLGLVNAPIQWGGVLWGAYIWNDVASKTPRDRKELFIHELFHGVQPQLRLGAAAGTPEHLDSKDGRYWLRLEWKALEQALRRSGEQRKLAFRDVLAFRQARHRLFYAGVEDERGQEITEGLAAYTATVMVAESHAAAIVGALDLLAGAEATATTASFVRTFAYMSGPAYGLLLDESFPGWRKIIRNTDDLAVLVMRALEVQPGTDASKAASSYEGTSIYLSEEQRERDRQTRLDDLRKTYVDGPVLVIPGGSHSYDSRGAVVLQNVGTVYFGPFRASGVWGKLEAEKGVLVSTDGSSRSLAAPVRQDETTFTGDGWSVKIAPGWKVHDGIRKGSYELVKDQ